MSESQQEYDYIIGGAGLAGLTLAWQMLESGLLERSSLLIIEPENKDKNDRTWCFWELNKPWLTKLPISKTWDKAEIMGQGFQKQTDLAPYRYFKIEGIDFYDFILDKITNHANITWLSEPVSNVNPDNNLVITPSGAWHFKEYFFKGHFYPQDLQQLRDSKKHFIWQHFLGWKIKTDEGTFQPDKITYMDMRVPEVPNGLAFAYVLPESTNKALVEYTLFSGELWEKKEYESALVTYIEKTLKIWDYEIVEEEFNKIPMTNTVFVQKNQRIIPIGTLAGTVKPSTGYSFIRNYHHIQKIIAGLKEGRDDFSVARKPRYRFYDEVLINVLVSGKVSGQAVFRQLYEKNDLRLLFRFLNEETTLWEDIKIMNSVPKLPFIRAVREELSKLMRF